MPGETRADNDNLTHSKSIGFIASSKQGWDNWRKKHRNVVYSIVVAIIICIVLILVVPPVCVLKGCGAGRDEQGSIEPEQVNRLIVSFDEIEKTVKSKVPPLLYEYLQELKLTFGISVVSFKNSNILDQVRTILEGERDLRILLRDSRQYRVPARDPWELTASIPVTALGGAAVPQGGERRRSQLATEERGDEFADMQWGVKVVQAPQAWNHTQGAGVIVAVIDTGCDLTHPDLKDHLWINPKEQGGPNKIDDDSNNAMDDVYGYDFAGFCVNNYDKDNKTLPNCGPRPNPQDTEGHGSHVAGIIAAIRNNGIGISGVAPNVRVMCLKVTPNDNTFYTAHILTAIDYAINMGAHIISCSFGPKQPNLNPNEYEKDTFVNETKAYSQAITRLAEKNILLVAAAGNENTDLDRLLAVGSMYNPCSMARDFSNNVICVMATNEQDKPLQDLILNKMEGTNFGSRTVDIAAPGRHILSTVPSNTTTGQGYYANKSGTSMATPVVSGIAALVMSILGSTNNNYYQGMEARKILIESADRLEGLPVKTSSRVNAMTAVQQALSLLNGTLDLVPLSSFNIQAQSVLAEGFDEKYYGGDFLHNREDTPKEPIDVSTRTSGKSRFEGFKRGGDFTVVITAYLNLPKAGLYSLKVNASASAGDVAIVVGQVKLPDLSDVYRLRSTGGWYAFELRYRNPAGVVDITISEPDGGGAPALTHLPLFFISTANKPRDYYFAPSIALSSTLQVLARHSDGIDSSSILESNLELNQPYNYSAVVEDLNFNTTDGMQTRLAITSETAGVVGMVHARLRTPSVPMQFKITCNRCALYVNTLRVADVYDPAPPDKPTATQVTGCVSFSNTSSVNDLVLRFAAEDVTNALLVLRWQPCGAGDNGDMARPLTDHTLSNIFWKPDSGVAGYVSGMQCDVWAYNSTINPTSETPTTSPLLKFRLPAAASQTIRAPSASFGTPTLINDVYRLTKGTLCTANETAGANCSANAAFRLKDLFTNGDGLNDNALGYNVYMRCWTFVDAGFKSGSVHVLYTDRKIYGYLGSQTVFQTVSTKQPYMGAPIAPNTTTLGGYYQLFAMEWRDGLFGQLIGILNGTDYTDFFTLDMRRTLLPFPIVRPPASQSPAAKPPLPKSSPRPPPPKNTKSSGAGRHRRRAAADAGEATLLRSDSRRLLQLFAPSNTSFNPSQLGSSTFSMDQISQSSTGLCVAVFLPNAASYFSELGLLSRAVLHNMTLSNRSASPFRCIASYGLAGNACNPPRNLNSSRYVQARTFIRVAASARQNRTTMTTYVLAVRDNATQTTAITMGDVTIRNAMEFPTSKTYSETVMWLPTGSGAAGEIYLPTTVTARSAMTGAQAYFDVLLNQSKVDEKFCIYPTACGPN